MYSSKRKQEMLALEKLLNDYIYRSKKNKQKKGVQNMEKYFRSLLSSKALKWFGLMYIISCAVYIIIFRLPYESYSYFTREVGVFIGFVAKTVSILLTSKYFKIFLIGAIEILPICFLILYIYRVYKEIKTSSSFWKSKNTNNIIQISEIDQSDMIIEEINKISQKSVARFEEKLKFKIDNLSENIKDLDLYLPLFVVFLVFSMRYIIGFDIGILGKNIASITGGLGLFASVVMVSKVLLINSPKTTVRHYQEFLLILKEAQIERVNPA